MQLKAANVATLFLSKYFAFVNNVLENIYGFKKKRLIKFSKCIVFLCLSNLNSVHIPCMFDNMIERLPQAY
jgi:hypothetical protein